MLSIGVAGYSGMQDIARAEQAAQLEQIYAQKAEQIAYSEVDIDELLKLRQNNGQYAERIGIGGESGSKTVNGYDTKVNVGQQNKHIPGTNEYKNALNNGQTKSIMYGDVNDIQNLLNDKAGTGDFIGANKERVNFGQVIGQYVDPDTGVGVETTIGIIHYGKKGHI